MNIHELYQAYCLYRHDNFSYGSQLITGQGQGDSYRVCASATLCSILAVWLQSLRVDCHVVMLSLSLLACALITMRVFFDLHLLDGFYEDTKESHCWKIKAAIKAWSGFFFFPWPCLYTSLMWSTSIQKQLVGRVIHTLYRVATVTHQIRMDFNYWCLERINMGHRSGMCTSTAKVLLGVSLPTDRK